MRLPRRPDLVPVVAATAVVLACTLAVVLHPVASRPLSDSLRAPDAPRDRQFEAIVVFQLEDCEGRLGVLELFRRPALRSAIRVTGLFVGAATALPQAERVLHRRGFSMRLRPASARAVQALRTVGFTGTPFLLVFDSLGRLRLTAPLPVEPEEHLRLATHLSLLSASGSPR